MKYNELKEMTFADWDGKPFRAIEVDVDDQELFPSDQMRYDGKTEGYLITGWNNERWINDSGLSWKHVYPLEWNKKPKKRMTNRELAMWLAKGNGQVKYSQSHTYTHHTYLEYLHHSDDEIDEGIKVRKWDSEEWIEPTTDLLEDC